MMVRTTFEPKGTFLTGVGTRTLNLIQIPRKTIAPIAIPLSKQYFSPANRAAGSAFPLSFSATFTDYFKHESEKSPHMSWGAVKKLLDVKPVNANSYYDCLPIQPGCRFYASLLPFRKKLRRLHLNVPSTVFSIDDDNYLVHTNSKHEIAIDEDVSLDEAFYRPIAESFERMDASYKQTRPAVFVKSSPYSDPCFMVAEALNCATFAKKVVRRLPQHDVLQQHLPGKASGSSFVRLVYSPKKQISEGHFVDNVLLSFDIVKPLDDKMHKYFGLPAGYEDVKYYCKRGSCLAEYENEAKKLYNFFLYDIGIRVKEITIDLVRAEDGSLWFVNLKSYVVDDNCYRLKQVQTMMKSGELAEERQIQREGASNTAFCKMCGLRLKVGELNKRLTLKMIYHVKGHLERRGIFIYSNLPHQPAETMTDTIKICSTCYSVAIAEYDLIETECKLAQIQGIPATVHTILNDDVGKKSKHSNAIMDPFLFQWRVMIHLESLLDIPAAFLRSTTEYSVQYKVFDYSISFPLTLRENNPFVLSLRLCKTFNCGNVIYYSKPTLKINKLRTYYFFSPTCDLDEFLKSENLSLRITEGSDWDSHVAQGSAKVFADCTTCDYVNHCVRYSKQVLLFQKSDITRTMKLKVNIGIIRGKKIDTSMIRMDPYGPDSIYFPPQSYLTSEQFPDDWMEIFDNSKSNKEEADYMHQKQLSYAFSIPEKDIGFFSPNGKRLVGKQFLSGHPSARGPCRESMPASIHKLSIHDCATALPFDRARLTPLEDKNETKFSLSVKHATKPDDSPELETAAAAANKDENFSSRIEPVTLVTARPDSKSRSEHKAPAKKPSDELSPEKLAEIREMLASMGIDPRTGKKKKGKKYHLALRNNNKLVKTISTSEQTESFKNPYATTSTSQLSMWQAKSLCGARKQRRAINDTMRTGVSSQASRNRQLVALYQTIQ